MDSVTIRTPFGRVARCISRVGVAAETIFYAPLTECTTGTLTIMLPTQGQTPVGPLVGMELPDLRNLLGPDQPAYRARQLYDALYRQQVANLSEISVLPKSLQNQLVTSTFMAAFYLPIQGAKQ